MTDDIHEQLREQDHAVLQKIQEGHDDTQKISQELTLKTHQIRYSLKKLEKLGLIKLNQPEEMVERVIDGQKRVFQHPKQAELTDKGKQYLEHSSREDFDEYRDLSHRELVEKVHRLEKQIGEIDKKFTVFRKQIQRRID